MRVAVTTLLLLLSGVLGGWSSSVRHLNAAEFDEVTGDGKTYFIKCGHCKNLAPTWEKLAVEYSDNSDAEVVSVDCTKNKALCKKAKIAGFPTLLVYQGGAEKAMYRGPRTLEKMKEFFEEKIGELEKETTA